MQIVWTVTLETDTAGPPDELQEATTRVISQLQETAFNAVFELVGDSASCSATVRIDP